tara:strand:+ start:255 stop:443 length:189 start_codon:yes stop_codon:yes gene_type:complete
MHYDNVHMDKFWFVIICILVVLSALGWCCYGYEEYNRRKRERYKTLDRVDKDIENCLEYEEI